MISLVNQKLYNQLCLIELIMKKKIYKIILKVVILRFFFRFFNYL